MVEQCFHAFSFNCIQKIKHLLIVITLASEMRKEHKYLQGKKFNKKTFVRIRGRLKARALWSPIVKVPTGAKI